MLEKGFPKQSPCILINVMFNVQLDFTDIIDI